MVCFLFWRHLNFQEAALQALRDNLDAERLEVYKEDLAEWISDALDIKVL